MENKPESLEEKLGRSDWKQWLPVYGVYQANRDFCNGKPSILNQDNSPHLGILFYQTFSFLAIGSGIAYGIVQLAEKLF